MKRLSWEIDVGSESHHINILDDEDNVLYYKKVSHKINEFAETYNLVFNKFEISKFMRDKGVIRKKIGSYNYYLDIDLVDDEEKEEK